MLSSMHAAFLASRALQMENVVLSGKPTPAALKVLESKHNAKLPFPGKVAAGPTTRGASAPSDVRILAWLRKGAARRKRHMKQAHAKKARAKARAEKARAAAKKARAAKLLAEKNSFNQRLRRFTHQKRDPDDLSSNERSLIKAADDERMTTAMLGAGVHTQTGGVVKKDSRHVSHVKHAGKHAWAHKITSEATKLMRGHSWE